MATCPITANEDGPETTLPLWRVMARYATTALVTLFLVAVVSAYVSRRLGTAEAVDDARRATALTATAGIQPLVTDDLVAMDPATIEQLDRVVQSSVIRGSLVRVKIWTEDGTVVYSDEPRLIGETFELDGTERALFGATPSWVQAQAEVSDLDEPENRYEDDAVKLLEVYVPIATPNGTPLLFEAYFRYSSVTDAGYRAWLRFAPMTLGSLVLLSMLQGPLVYSIATRLRRTQRQREELLRQAIEATDDERRRIAGDLHDGVVQDLAGVTFALAATGREVDGQAKAQIATAGNQLRDAIRSLRSLLVEIYPPNLADEDLESSLSDLMARLDPRGIGTTLTVHRPVDDLDLDVKQLVYRTTQEALRNVIAHSRATRVAVDVDLIDDRVVLRVVDDGCGFRPDLVAENNGHLGLRSLQGLARSVGARLDVTSHPGEGTELRLEVPRR